MKKFKADDKVDVKAFTSSAFKNLTVIGKHPEIEAYKLSNGGWYEPDQLELSEIPATPDEQWQKEAEEMWRSEAWDLYPDSEIDPHEQPIRRIAHIDACRLRHASHTAYKEQVQREVDAFCKFVENNLSPKGIYAATSLTTRLTRLRTITQTQPQDKK
jgi:hypothetical protein